MYVYWLIRWTALLWHAICTPFRCWFLHLDSRCGYVSQLLSGHNVSMVLECDMPEDIFSMVAHVLCISKFDCVGYLGF